jgi:glycosyltransferase involved in cell wall biosynthesis
MKVLWLSNKVLSDKDDGSTGTWLVAMAHSLVATGEVELCNVSMGKVKVPTRQDAGPCRQWIVPGIKTGRAGLPPARIVAGIISVVNDVAPDLVHVWGTENYWGLLTARGLIQTRALLEIQGLKEPYSRVFAGGLTELEQRACIGIKEIIKSRNIASKRSAFERWSRFEREIIAGHSFVTAQSPWVEAWVKVSNASARIFHVELALREPFYSAKPWRPQNASVIFCSAAYPVPYKGIHNAVRALAILSRQVPNARLRIAGALKSRGIRQDGYIAWVDRLAASLHVADKIDWLGALSATEIVAELQNCSVMLIPSHCETYCVALAEALYLGVPAVSAHTGGTVWLARDEESALFYSPGDEVMCAYQLERILTDQGLAERLSRNARDISLVRNNSQSIVNNQLKIYRQVIEQSKKDIV